MELEIFRSLISNIVSDLLSNPYWASKIQILVLKRAELTRLLKINQAY